jgi:2-amino-4-hydroxy-6-hydroxymethyldihydropteridine diphosphokinase / dihydropteroate synthase
MRNHCILSIGGNIGNRAANLSRAVRSLQEQGVEVLRWSSLFETAPQHVTDQPAFLNAALWCRTDRPPLDLLRLLKKIEKNQGRDFQV